MPVLFSEIYPPPAFYFKVAFDQNSGISDTSFQEVSGMTAEVTTESLVEGGENNFVHTLPTGLKHPNLQLKRGVASTDSPLIEWCRDVFEMGFIKPVAPQSLMVQLLDQKGEPLRGWFFGNAWPIKWEVANLSSTKNEVLIETIELSYTYSFRVM